MGYQNALNLRDKVTRARTTQTSDGMGGYTSTTATATIGHAALWSIGGDERYLSDQVIAVSSHVLACRVSDDVAFGDVVSYDGVDYTVTSHADDVANRGRVKIVPMKRIN